MARHVNRSHSARKTFTFNIHTLIYILSDAFAHAVTRHTLHNTNTRWAHLGRNVNRKEENKQQQQNVC